MKKEIRILFTSVGRRVELMRAFKRAFDELGVEGTIIGTDIDALAPAAHVVDRAVMVPRFTDPDFVPALERAVEKTRPDLIFPLIDPDIPVLAENRERLEAFGARVVVSPTSSIARSNDKWRTFEFFSSLGLETPQSWLPEDLDPEAVEYPVFLKPRAGSGSAGAHKINDAEEFRFYAKRVADPIVQEWLPGPEITSDVICSLSGGVVGISCRQRIEVRWGEVCKGVTVKRRDVIEGCVKVAEGFGGVGPLTVQCMLKDGVPRFTEINARFGGGMPLGVAAGNNAPAMLVAEHLGLDMDLPPLGSFTEGLHLTRFDDSHFLRKEDLERIQSGRI